MIASKSKDVTYSRHFCRILKDLSAENGVEVCSRSSDWVFVLRRAGSDDARLVIGYQYQLNSASSSSICHDKAAAAACLELFGIPAVPHHLVLSPEFQPRVTKEGAWQPLLDFLRAHPPGVVVKPNEGTGGEHVLLARTEQELDVRLNELWRAGKNAAAVCPYLGMEMREFRVVVLCGQAWLGYRKDRAAVVGDGRHTAGELFGAQYLRQAGARAVNLPLRVVRDWDRVLAPGEAITVEWRHNLGLGATPHLLWARETMHGKIVEEDPELASLRPQLEELALRASRSLNMTFCSVDIVQPAFGGQPGAQEDLQVLEINSGVMMEKFIECHPRGGHYSKALYRHAFQEMWKKN